MGIVLTANQDYYFRPVPTIERIRELCAKIAVAQSGPEFDRLMQELTNAIDVLHQAKETPPAATETSPGK